MGASAKRNFFMRNNNPEQLRQIIADEEDDWLESLNQELRNLPTQWDREERIVKLLLRAKGDPELTELVGRFFRSGRFYLELIGAQKRLPRAEKTFVRPRVQPKPNKAVPELPEPPSKHDLQRLAQHFNGR
jgi:hypothetical protein